MVGKWLFLIGFFGVVGIGIETIITALDNWRKYGDRCLRGYSSIWYIPLYASAPVVFAVLPSKIWELPWFLRGGLYTILIFIVEFLGMLALRMLLGSSPSEEEYYRSPYNVYGLIRLDLAPLWFCLGLIFEFLFKVLSGVSL